MQAITQLELQETLARAQRGEDLEKRKKRPLVLEEYFRRRKELLRQVQERSGRRAKDFIKALTPKSGGTDK